MRNSLKLRQDIVNYLVKFKFRIQTNNELDLYDVNKLSQDFIATLLNIFSLDSESNFINLDKIAYNYPAVDVGCLKQKIAYQVTSQNDSQKIYTSINSFKKYHLGKGKFESLRFVILNDISWSQKQLDNIQKKYEELGLTYDDETIVSLKDLGQNLKKLDDDKLKKLLKLLKNELDVPNKNNFLLLSLVFFLVFIGGILFLNKHISKESPVFPKNDDFNILILSFDPTKDCSIESQQYENQLNRRIASQTKGVSNIEIGSLPIDNLPKEDSNLLAIAKKHNASLIIWGDYIEECDKASKIRVNYLVTSGIFISDNNKELKSSYLELPNVEDLENKSFKLELDNLINWILVLHYFDKDTDKAGELILDSTNKCNGIFFS